MSATVETATRQTLRPSRRDLTVLGHTVAIAVSGIAMTYGVGLATQANLLIPLAAPLGIGLVLAMSWIPYRTQIIGWAVLTVWLLSTVYLGLDALEPVALVVIVLLSLAGVFKSPWLLVAVWALHPVWDLAVPRQLSTAQADLPLGCLIYDLIVAAYLAWRTVRAARRGEPATRSVPWPSAVKNMGYAVVAGLVVLIEVLVAWWAADQGLLVAVAAPLGLVVVLGLWWLPAHAQRVAWVVVTGWMGMTYAHSGVWYEIVVFLVIVVLAMLGATRSSWWFVIAWAAHLVWNAWPRVVAHHHSATMGHLGLEPAASAIYDAVVLVALAIAVRRGRI